MNDRKDGGNDGGGNLCDRNKKKFLDTQVSLAPTPVRPSVRPSVSMEGNTFGLPFCQRLWDLIKCRDDIAVAAMVADMEVHIVADMEVDKMADKVANKVADKKTKFARFKLCKV